jgi:hypothetical protein
LLDERETTKANHQSKDSEASILFQALLASGIPECAMITEDMATNTGENVISSRELVKELRIAELPLVGKICPKRRYIMTVRKQWPEIRRIRCHGVNYSSCPASQWWKEREFRTRVISECRKIPRYIERGFISEVSIIDGVVL